MGRPSRSMRSAQACKMYPCRLCPASLADNATKFDGGEIVRNAEENRLQILFDEIPDADTRDALKSNGFRWSPRNKAWQRQLTQNAEYAARRVLGL